ncbi:MAG: sulfurtransferase [Anaerolineaceae bacterium]|nr:sulfurtransferase [Anaerolineaceae bacterium]
MTYTTLISAEELAEQLFEPGWVVVDCRFVLTDVDRGRQDYQASHIAGAVYAHLDEDLSGPIIPGQTGRHPLPDIDKLARALSGWGIDQKTQVVAYDGGGGGIAARLWWLLRWLGHNAVAVLDGGWANWPQFGYPVRSGIEANTAKTFTPRPRPELIFDAEAVEKIRTDPAYRLGDARGADRFRGENETLDPVAGHIPGAISLPFAANLGPDQRFLPVEKLKERFQAALEETPAEHTVFYCGSGVTAAHNVLAMVHAGRGEARLYPGSWSEWITEKKRPVGKD